MTTVLEPLGVDLGDVPLDLLTDDDIEGMRLLLADHGVAVARDQDLDDDGFGGWLGRLGNLMFTVGETPVPGHPDLNIISNIGRSAPPRSVFHVDTSYVSRPPAYTALRAVEVPERGGRTLFSNQFHALETLPDDLRAAVQGRVVTHVVTGVDPGTAQQHRAQHPLVRPHPLTGRLALYLTTPERCVGVSGLADARAAELIETLYAHSTRPDNVYRHRWRRGDVVIWDNAAVMHRADHAGVVGNRVMHRGMVEGRLPGAGSPR